MGASTLSISFATSILSAAVGEGIPRVEDPSEAAPAAGDRCEEDARVIGLLVDSIPILLIAASAACRLALTSSLTAASALAE
jgi:hypothetical protein